MPKIDIEQVHRRQGSTYPSPYNEMAAARIKEGLGNAVGLQAFGVNLTQLPPGAWSSQRHWHSAEDEFVYILSGEVTLVTDAGEEILRAGDCAAFPKNTPDGHNMINKSGAMAVYLEIGTRTMEDVCTYPDIDMIFDKRR